MVWLIKQKGDDEDDILRKVASYAVSCIEQSLRLRSEGDEKKGKKEQKENIYQARIQLLQSGVPDTIAESELLKVVGILEDSTKKLLSEKKDHAAHRTCLENFVFSTEGLNIIVEIKGHHRSYLKELYQALMMSINRHNYEEENCLNNLPYSTAHIIKNIKEFDFSKFGSKKVPTESALKDLKACTESSEEKKDKAA